MQGLTSKLDYIQQLGVNALWISSPLEQIHGWVGGGMKGDFPHMPITATSPVTGLSWTLTWGRKKMCAGLADEGPQARDSHSVRRGDEPYRLRDRPIVQRVSVWLLQHPG